MRKKIQHRRRSDCPLNASVEMLGDRWSLLIATNILTDRLRKLAADGIVTSKRDPSDGRSRIYLLTAKGIGLAPVLTELVLWAAAHERTGRPALVRQMREDKAEFLAGVRRGWKQRAR